MSAQTAPLVDDFGRTVTYLRVSVTDRCNVRCVYCMPPEGVPTLSHDDMLSYEDIADFVRVAVDRGIDKVRLTGGEPLVRKGIVALVEMLARIEGIRDLSMTTNGILLASLAGRLAAAGLHRVNVSLDALDPERYAAITRGGEVRHVIEGIHAAVAAGLTPIKLNCVVAQSSQEQDARAVAEFGRQHGFEVRFIHRMSLAAGRFQRVEGGEGGWCERCNRLRLSSTGLLRPCLFNDRTFDIRTMGNEAALDAAVRAKPRSGTASKHNHMHEIGG